VPGTAAQRAVVRYEPHHTGASVDVRFLGEQEGERLSQLQSAARTLTLSGGRRRSVNAAETTDSLVQRRALYIYIYIYRYR